MNIYVSCSKCIRESQNPINVNDIQSYKVPVSEEGIYTVTCYKGHETTAISWYDKYEILFQMGANALLDGFYFEAVGCFIASVERFREWCIKFFWYLNGIEENHIKKVWGNLKRSERQLGAFYSMFLQHFKESPPIFSSQMDQFRNNVLHNGEIPTMEETYTFGEYTFNYLRSVQKIIQQSYDKETFEFKSKTNKRNWENITEEQVFNGEVVFQNSPDMILLLEYSVLRNTSFNDEIELFKKYKDTYI